MNAEQRFLHTLTRPALANMSLEHTLAQLWRWMEDVHATLSHHATHVYNWDKHSSLRQQCQGLSTLSQRILVQSEQEWDAQQHARALAQHFDNTLILLIFGKFNAGKSSLCNFLAERLGGPEQIKHFQFTQGHVVYSEQGFLEGATETTATVQGVEIGEHLVLLDTPGLHSTTPDNAALTLRYTESADAILWLSSSTSPGQVQELDELARELQRRKSLLPVITRSDFYDEDLINGEICKVLCNKTTDTRRQQEQDLNARAHTKLEQLGVDVTLLRPAVSVSVHMARAQGQDDASQQQSAGLERLYTALAELAAPALAYKQRKPAEVLLHHLQETVQTPLKQQLLPELQALRDTLHAEHHHILTSTAHIGQAVWRTLMSALPAWIQTQANSSEHLTPYDKAQNVCRQLSTALEAQLLTQLSQTLPQWPIHLLIDAGTLTHFMAQHPFTPPPTLPTQDWTEKLYHHLREAVQQCLLPSELRPVLTPYVLAVEDLLEASQHMTDLLEQHLQALHAQAMRIQDLMPAPHLAV